MKVVMPGSFDPFTIGHLDILERAVQLFDQVIVAVGTNSGKRNLIGMERRVELIGQVTAGMAQVSVEAMDGLLVDFCRARGVTVVVRGARSGADFEAEMAMAALNASLGGVETIVLPASATIGYISSSLVRSVALAGGDVSAYVPNTISQALREGVVHG